MQRVIGVSLSEPHTRESGGENSVCTCMLACIRQISRANCRFKNVRVSILDCNNYSLVPYPPSLTPLFHGHIIDTVHLLLVLKRGEVPSTFQGAKVTRYLTALDLKTFQITSVLYCYGLSEITNSIL